MYTRQTITSVDDDSPESVGYCTSCGCDIENDLGYSFGKADYLCEDCVAHCDICGDTVPGGETTEIRNLTVCFDCAE